MNILSRLNKPEYFYRPMQVFRTIGASQLMHDAETIVTLPWGSRLAIDPREEIGRTILRLGVYDLCISEAIMRLLDRNENAVDVGANIGYITSLMSAKVGPEGSVQSFEPHPMLYDKLVRNQKLWGSEGFGCGFRIEATAISSREGFATLRIPAGFKDNQGIASLEENTEGAGIRVPVKRLDSAVAEQNIGLMKIDVEGHELQVLLGAGRLITNRQVRDILFEEENNYPTPTTNYLEEHGYKIYGIGMRFRGPVIAAGGQINKVPRREWQPKSLLATCSRERAESRFRARGWSVLRTLSQPSYSPDPDDSKRHR